MWVLTAGVSSAVDWATWRRSVGASPGVPTAQGITGQVTTNTLSLSVQQSRAHSAATRWRNALIAKVIILNSVAGE